MKRLVLLTIAVLPAATALAAVRPVAAEPTQGFGSFGLTVTAAALRTDGVVGASGGLVTLDSGTGYSTGRLDGAPSSYSLAAPVEPGTLARTVVGTVNTEAGTTVLTVPDAQTAYPGPASASTAYAPAQSAGPLTVTPGTATSSAGPHRATGSTTATALSVGGAGDASRLAATTTLTGDAAAGQGRAEGTGTVGSLTVAGVLVLHDVAGRASVTVTGGRPVSAASLTVGSATVAGVPVTVDQDGVHVAGQVSGTGPFGDVQQQVNSALAAAGVSVRVLGVTHSVTGRSGYADSGGLLVELRTPDLPGGVAANDLTLTVGRVNVTGTSTAAEPLLPVVVPPAVVPPVAPGTTTTVTVTEGTGGVPASGAVAAPAPVLAGSRGEVRVVGRRMTAAAALAAFGVWQLLSLSTTTLYALVDRRRRLEEDDA